MLGAVAMGAIVVGDARRWQCWWMVGQLIQELNISGAFEIVRLLGS
jgi:hypothetical protein